MKRSGWSLAHFLFLVPLLAAQTTAPPPPPNPPQTAAPAPAQPVFLYLYATVPDQVNLDITEDRLRHLLPMIARYRSAHPDDYVSATILFSGAVSHALDQSNAKTHIKDFILDYKKRGVIEVGYDGTDEPTYEHRPMFKISENSGYEDRWKLREEADQKFLTEARDPVTGATIPGAAGGLEEMQRVFGEASCIRGIGAPESITPRPNPPQPPSPMPPGMINTEHAANPDLKPEVGDYEVVPVLRKYNTRAVLFGLSESNPYDLSGYKTAVREVEDMMSPAPDTSPELYWVNNVLHTAEWSGGLKPVARTLHGYEGADALKDFLTGMARAKVQIVHVELASEKDYLKPDFIKTWTNVTSSSPSLLYAYAHPDSPKLPADARLSTAEVNANYAKEDASLKWLTEDYLPANAGSHFVASSDFEHMTPPANGYSISVPALQTALSDWLRTWGINTFPPNYLLADGHYLSMAEAFQVMTDSLAEFDRTGKLPQSVKVVRVYGPIGLQPGHGPNNGVLSMARIAKECSTIAPALHDETADPMPHNSIPPGFVIDKIPMTSAQFLRMMAQAIVNPVPDAQLNIKMTYMFTGVSQLMPKTRSMTEVGATWTFKPAPIEVPGVSQAAR